MGKGQCPVCGKILSRKLKDHLRSHKVKDGGEKQFVCTVCKETFIRPGDRNRHQRLHTATQHRFRCICGYKSHKKGDLNRHLESNVSGRCREISADETATPEEAYIRGSSYSNNDPRFPTLEAVHNTKTSSNHNDPPSDPYITSIRPDIGFHLRLLHKNTEPSRLVKQTPMDVRVQQKLYHQQIYTQQLADAAKQMQRQQMANAARQIADAATVLNSIKDNSRGNSLTSSAPMSSAVFEHPEPAQWLTDVPATINVSGRAEREAPSPTFGSHVAESVPGSPLSLISSTRSDGFVDLPAPPRSILTIQNKIPLQDDRAGFAEWLRKSEQQQDQQMMRMSLDVDQRWRPSKIRKIYAVLLPKCLAQHSSPSSLDPFNPAAKSVDSFGGRILEYGNTSLVQPYDGKVPAQVFFQFIEPVSATKECSVYFYDCLSRDICFRCGLTLCRGCFGALLSTSWSGEMSCIHCQFPIKSRRFTEPRDFPERMRGWAGESVWHPADMIYLTESPNATGSQEIHNIDNKDDLHEGARNVHERIEYCNSDAVNDEYSMCMYCKYRASRG